MVIAAKTRPRFDLLHLHTPMTGAFGVIGKAVDIPVVVQMHGVDWQRSKWGPIARTVIHGLEWLVMRNALACTAVSQTQCSDYEARYGRRTLYIPTGTQAAFGSQGTIEIEKLGLEKGKYVLFLSRFVPEKGAHYLIRAFRRSGTNMSLALAGGDPNAGRYERSLHELACGDSRIVFPGFVEGDQKEQLIANAAIYVQPSEIEGLSIALLDAMAHGLPCLASDIPENMEAIGGAGIAFKKNDSDSLLAKLEALIANPQLRLRLGALARERALRNFSWDAVTDALEQYYLELTEGATEGSLAGWPNGITESAETEVGEEVFR